MKKLLFLFLLILGAAQAKAQVIKGSIDMKDSTITRNITFDVAAGSRRIKFSTKGYLTAGEFSVALIDPNGKWNGGFRLTSVLPDGSSEPSKGEWGNSVSPPVPGTWRFYISAQKGTGRFSYEIDIIKP